AAATFIADLLADRHAHALQGGAEAAHCAAVAAFAGRDRRDGVAAAAEAIARRVKLTGRCADPANDDLALSVGETSDPPGKVLREAGFPRCQRQLDQCAAFI